MTPKVSLRTLVLLVELLVAVLALQYLASARPAQAQAVWLAGDGTAIASSRAEPGNSTTAP